MAKISREELERDEVAQSIKTAVDTARSHMKQLALGAIVLIVVIGGGMAYTANRASASQDTTRTLVAAAKIFTELRGLEDDQTRRERLEGSIATLDDLLKTRGNNPPAHYAHYLKGNCYYYMDDFENAKKAYEAFIGASTSDVDRARGQIALGYAHENEYYLTEKSLDQLGDASKYFEQAAKSAPAGSYLQHEALLDQARIMELQHRDADALAIYKKVMADRPAPRPLPDTSELPAGGLEQYVLTQIHSMMEPLSYYATAKMRAERLEAKDEVFTTAVAN